MVPKASHPLKALEKLEDIVIEPPEVENKTKLCMLALVRVVRIMPAHGRCQVQRIELMQCQNGSW